MYHRVSHSVPSWSHRFLLGISDQISAQIQFISEMNSDCGAGFRNMKLFIFLSWCVFIVGSTPSFPGDWSSKVEVYFWNNHDDFSALPTTPSIPYFVQASAKSNATRVYGTGDISVVSLFDPKTSMECYVDEDRSCQFFCPLGGASMQRVHSTPPFPAVCLFAYSLTLPYNSL